MIGWLLGSKQREAEAARERALKAFYVLRCSEFDCLDNLTEVDFEQWRDDLLEFELNEFTEAGAALLAEPEQFEAVSGEFDLDNWLPFGNDIQRGYRAYGEVQRGWGAVVLVARIHSWFLGLPW